MSIQLDDAIVRLTAAHAEQDKLASDGRTPGKKMLAACEARDKILAEVIELGSSHLAAFDDDDDDAEDQS